MGTGSGYQAAVLAEICSEVFTIEVKKPLADAAFALLNNLGYINIKAEVGSGYGGWPDVGPFDAIIVTAAPKEIPQALLLQLKIGGKIIMPLELSIGNHRCVY